MEYLCLVCIKKQLFLPTLRECQILQSLNHNNIVKVTDFYMTDSTVYKTVYSIVTDTKKGFPDFFMVMEYISFIGFLYQQLLQSTLNMIS